MEATMATTGRASRYEIRTLLSRYCPPDRLGEHRAPASRFYWARCRPRSHSQPPEDKSGLFLGRRDLSLRPIARHALPRVALWEKFMRKNRFDWLSKQIGHEALRWSGTT